MEVDKTQTKPAGAEGENKGQRGGGTRGGPRRGGNKEGGEKREKREDRPEKTKFVKKGEEGAQDNQGEAPKEGQQGEEHKGEKGDRRRNDQRRERKKENVEITLETVIPELPKKNERLKEPNQTELDDKIDKLDQKISDLFNKKHNYIEEMRNQHRENRHKKEGVALRDVLTAKQDERKKINEEFKIVNEEHNELKKEYEKLQGQNDKLREKLRKYFTVGEIKAEIAHLKDIVGNEKISMQEEKKLVREIDNLEASLPFAEPYEKHQKLLTECQTRKNEVGKRKKNLWEKLQEANKEVDNVRGELEKISNLNKEEQKEVGPAVSSKVDEYNNLIQKHRGEKKDLIKKFHEDWAKYEEQQHFIKRVEWMQRVKARLVREEERKKREEEWKKQEEEEKKKAEDENKPTGHPYREEIDLCDRLVKYLKPFIPRVAPVEEKKEAVPENSNRYVPKKQQESFLIAPKQTKKVQKQPQNEPVEKKEKAQPKLNHHLEIVNGFESIKLLPPTYAADVEKVIKQIEEKRAYFRGQTERPDVPKPAEDDKGKESPNQSPTKKHRAPVQVSNLDDEKEFPGLG